MKKKGLFIFFLPLVFVLLCAWGMATKPQNFDARAESLVPNLSYLISNGADGNSFSLSYSDDSDTTLATSDSLQTILTKINEDIDANLTGDTSEPCVAIYFDNIATGETATLNFAEGLSVVLSGSITSTTDQTILEIDEKSSSVNFYFNELLLSSDCEHIASVGAASSGIKVIVENCTFSSDILGSYAIFFASGGNSLSFGGNNNLVCTYFANYSDELSLLLSSEPTNTNALAFTFPYDITKNAIFDCDQNNYDKITFVPLSSNYYASTNVTNSIYYLYARVYVDLNASGGIYNSSIGVYTPPTSLEYNLLSAYTFPNSTLLSKSGATFNGWYGVVEIDEAAKLELGTESQYLYFGADELQAIYDFAGDDLSELTNTQILAFFKDSFFEASSPITRYYRYSSQPADYLCLQVFMQLNLSPVFQMKWDYTISFNTNGGNATRSLILTENQPILLDDTSLVPEKEGYTFAGWFMDAELSEELNLETMPSRNFTLYAGYRSNIITLTLYSIFDAENPEASIFETYADYVGETIDFGSLEPSRYGYTFQGWFLSTNFDEEYTSNTMPDADTSLFALWTKNTYIVRFDMNNGSGEVQEVGVLFEDQVSEINAPTKLGSEFLAWHTSLDFSSINVFDFSTPITENITLYAEWFDHTYYINFVTNTTTTVARISATYGEEIDLPTTLSRTNYSFTGWFSDEALTTKFTQTTMPLGGATLYAGWKEKQALNISFTAQTYSVTAYSTSFKTNTNLNGFIVSYYVDGNWTTNLPTAIGSYDVKITRAEDDTYASFETIIENGLTLEAVTLNMYWLAILFFILFAIELAVSIFLIHLRKVKANLAFSFPLIFGGTSLLPTSQFVVILISGTLALFGLILLIYELVMLNRTNLIISNEPSKLDNRERFKEDLTFQESEENYELDFTVPTKTEESFGDKYSEEDVLNILANDEFAKKINEKRKKFMTEDDPSERSDAKNENGSSVVNTAKEKHSIIKERFDDELVIEYVDDDEDDDGSHSKRRNQNLDESWKKEFLREIQEENEAEENEETPLDNIEGPADFSNNSANFSDDAADFSDDDEE